MGRQRDGPNCLVLLCDSIELQKQWPFGREDWLGNWQLHDDTGRRPIGGRRWLGEQAKSPFLPAFQSGRVRLADRTLRVDARPRVNGLIANRTPSPGRNRLQRSVIILWIHDHLLASMGTGTPGSASAWPDGGWNQKGSNRVNRARRKISRTVLATGGAIDRVQPRSPTGRLAAPGNALGACVGRFLLTERLPANLKKSFAGGWICLFEIGDLGQNNAHRVAPFDVARLLGRRRKRKRKKDGISGGKSFSGVQRECRFAAQTALDFGDLLFVSRVNIHREAHHVMVFRTISLRSRQ